MNELISLIFATHKIIKCELQGKTDANQISLLNLKALYILEENKNMTMRDLANELSITPASTTSLTNSLIGNKYIVRRLDSSDRRVIHLSLTPQGRAKLRAGSKAVVARMQTIFAKLNDKDQKSLISILKKLNEAYV